jgi:hypothetical protein
VKPASGMVGKFLGSLFGNGSTQHAVAEQTYVVEDERAAELDASTAALNALRCDLRLSAASLPTVAYSQFRQIDDLITALVTHIRASGASTEQCVLLGAIVGDYLPTSLSTYLMLPKSARRDDSPESRALYTQLSMLHSTAVNLNNQVRSGAATELAIHGRFLRDKFDLSSLHLEGI